eukprot:6053006-Amphidinium_carterae.1
MPQGGDEPGAGAPPTESGKSYGAAGSTPPVASGTAAAPTVSGKTYGAGGVAATVYGASTVCRACLEMLREEQMRINARHASYSACCEAAGRCDFQK